jgi:Mn2+/Fe2+ NRAMP family transporter
MHLMLNNREWAILIWGVGVFLILMARREIRSSVGQLLRIVLSLSFLIPLLLMVGYVVGEVWLGYKARLWRSDLIRET